jgi:hypothetical protein
MQHENAADLVSRYDLVYGPPNKEARNTPNTELDNLTQTVILFEFLHSIVSQLRFPVVSAFQAVPPIV